MNESGFLENIARDMDWLSFAKSLSSALRNPTKYGFTDSERLLARIAYLRGADPTSLRNPLTAYSWLEHYAPDALKLDGQRLPMTGVLTLSQICELSEEVGSEVAPKFFSGDVTRKDLKSILADLQKQKGGRGVRGHERYKNSVEFEQQVRDYIKENVDVFRMGPEAQVVPSSKDALVPSDLTVMFKGKPVAAIEIKSHRHKRHRKFLVETLAMASLLGSEYHESILIVPSSWGKSISEMSDLISKLSLGRVKLAVFNDEPNIHPRERLRFQKPYF